MGYEAVNFNEKFKLFDEQWKPKVIAEMNDYQFKVVRLRGDFIWHDHKNTDETFTRAMKVASVPLKTMFGFDSSDQHATNPKSY